MKKRFLAAALALGLVMGSVSVSAATKDPNPTRVNTYSTGGKVYFDGKTTTFVEDGDGIDTVKIGSTTVKGEGKKCLDMTVSKAGTMVVTDKLGNKKSFKCVKDTKNPTIKYTFSKDKSTLTFVCKDSTSRVAAAAGFDQDHDHPIVKSSLFARKTETLTVNLKELRAKHPEAVYICVCQDEAGNRITVQVKDPVKSGTVTEASDTTYSCPRSFGKLAKSTVYVSEACDFVINEKNGLKSIKVGSKTIRYNGLVSATVKVSQSCTVKVTDQRGDTASMKVVVDSRKPTVTLSQSKGTLKIKAKDNAQLTHIDVEEEVKGVSTHRDGTDVTGKSATKYINVSKYSGKKLTVSVYDCAGNWVEKEITIK